MQMKTTPIDWNVFLFWFKGLEEEAGHDLVIALVVVVVCVANLVVWETDYINQDGIWNVWQSLRRTSTMNIHLPLADPM